MKPVAVLLTIVFAVVALSITVWLGRYQGAIAIPQLASQPDAASPSELEIPANGPFGKAVTDTMQFNFGTVSLGTKGEHTFVIKNEGKGPLQVKPGKTSCSQCTHGGVSREDAIPPGETVEVTIKWEIKAPSEKFRQWAEIHTTDPDNRRIQFTIEGQVDRPLRLTPEEVWSVGDLKQNEPTEVKGALYSMMLDEVKIDRFECTNPKVSVKWDLASPELLAEHKAKSGLQITVSVPADAPLGPLRESVTLFTTLDKRESKLSFGLTGQKSGPIELKGPRWNPDSNFLAFGEFPASEGMKGKLFLYVRDMDEELVLEGVEQKFNTAKITCSPVGKVIGKSKMYILEVEIPPGSPVKHRLEDSEQIRLKLNHPSAKEFRFYISYHAL
jgi:Protein of unknown function (DUF1573)